MLFLKRILAHWVDQGWRSEEEQDNSHRYPEPTNVRAGIGRGTAKLSSNRDYGDDGSGVEFKNPLNITLYNAMGGRIVKFHSYDRQAEQSNETTYIIPSDLDFEVELGKCIAMESLKHKL